MTQRELARRARTAQSVVARIELAATSPSLDTLARLLRAAGFGLETALRRITVDPAMLYDVPRILRLTPEERLREAADASSFISAARLSDVAPFDPERLIRALTRNRVKFVLIRALAARLHGFPRLTADADITPATDKANLERLASALKELDAKVYTESVPEGLAFDRSAAALARAQMWKLVTSAGGLDIAFTPAGTKGYEDLAGGAEKFEAFGVEFLAASLDDIIRSKEASGRAKDEDDVVVLRALKKKLRT